jgi:hypothetical protein
MNAAAAAAAAARGTRTFLFISSLPAYARLLDTISCVFPESPGVPRILSSSAFIKDFRLAS